MLIGSKPDGPAGTKLRLCDVSICSHTFRSFYEGVMTKMISKLHSVSLTEGWGKGCHLQKE
jgi:hypothetical protein